MAAWRLLTCPLAAIQLVLLRASYIDAVLRFVACPFFDLSQAQASTAHSSTHPLARPALCVTRLLLMRRCMGDPHSHLGTSG